MKKKTIISIMVPLLLLICFTTIGIFSKNFRTQSTGKNLLQSQESMQFENVETNTTFSGNSSSNFQPNSSQVSSEQDDKKSTYTESTESIIENASSETAIVEFEEYDITIMAVGDNLMHMGVVNTGHQSDGTYNYSFLFENIKDFLANSDIRVINQETILGGNELGFSGFPYFNSPTEVGDAIREAGFNVVLHATNHAADQGVRGLNNCIKYWSDYPEVLMAGIHSPTTTVSDSDNTKEDITSIQILEINDKSFAILNYTYGPNMEILSKDLRGKLDLLCSYDENSGYIHFTQLNPQVITDIEEADKLADYVIVFPHWGTEYQKTPSKYQQEWAEEMTQAGADFIIGTHPHVPQPIQTIQSENGNTSLCYYSLGNYVSTQKQALCMLEGMAWITIHVTEHDSYIDNEKTGVIPFVCHYRSNPVRIENIYLLQEYTEDLATSHGIWNYGGVPLHLSDLTTWSEEIFGDYILDKQDIIPKSP